MAEEKHHLRGIPYLFSATPFEKAGRGRFHGEQNGLTRFEFTVIRETLWEENGSNDTCFPGST